MPREFTTYVAGVCFPNADGSNRTFNVRLCAPSDSVELRLESKNKHDPHAIAVFSIRVARTPGTCRAAMQRKGGPAATAP